jgi:hypothetical protein
MTLIVRGCCCRHACKHLKPVIKKEPSNLSNAVNSMLMKRTPHISVTDDYVTPRTIVPTPIPASDLLFVSGSIVTAGLLLFMRKIRRKG